MMDDAVDQSRGAGGIREDAGPVLEGEIGGEHEALLFIPSTDDLKEQVGVSLVEGEIAYLVEDQEADLRVALEAVLEGASGFLSGEVEQELSGGGKEHGVAGEDRLVGDILGEHRFSEPLWRDEHDIARR